MASSTDDGHLEAALNADPSFTRPLPDLAVFDGDPSRLIDQLSDDDRRILQPVLQKQVDSSHVVNYSVSDINVLRSIVQVALRATDTETVDSNSFITIFKSYETVLRRKKIDTSKETFFFKLVVKLCRAPGSSWAEKFNNLLLEISSHLIENRKPQLESLYRDFLRSSVLVPTLRKWHSKAIYLHNLTRALRRVAVKYDQSILTTHAFEIWRTKLYEYDVRENEVIALNNERIARSYLEDWREKSLQLGYDRESAADLFTKYIWFGRMKAVRSKSVELQERLDAVLAAQREAVARKYFRVWFFALQDINARVSYDTVLAGKCLDKWISELEVADSLNERADKIIALRDRQTRLIVLDYWRQSTKQVTNLNRIADAFHRQLLIRKTWLVWTRETILELSRQELEQTNNLALKKHTFSHWKTSTDMIVSADILYQSSLAHRYLKRMRERLREQLLSETRDRRLEHRTLYHWVLKERSVLLGRVSRRRGLKNAFAAWRRATAKRVESDKSAVVAVYETGNYRVVAEAMRTWKLKTAALYEMYNQAMDFDELVMYQKFFAALTSKYQRITHLTEQAEAVRKTTLLKTHFAKWQTQLSIKRQNRRESLLQDLLSAKRTRRKSAALRKWVDRTVEVVELSIQADEFYVAYGYDSIARRCLQQWSDRYLAVSEMSSLADEFSDTRLKQTYLAKWHQRKLDLDDSMRRSAAVYDINSLLRAQNLLRRWNMRAIQVGILKARADAFHERARKARAKGLFANWVDLTREIIYASDEQLGRKLSDSPPDETSTTSYADEDYDSDLGTIVAGSISTTTTEDSASTYTPTKRRSGTRVSFSGRLDDELRTPKMERWARLRNSPMYEGRRKLFATPVVRRGAENGFEMGKTV
ncbi:Sfi1 spindle body protein-domain-containing protein [Myxozyma melibiosi]|uniref:Sfi1 spindle body protein-domain-containing protein n=1 Tax=Myxozyma melibiosi TaxID=54550 RepID=A0ABR1FB45_9ASCO